MMARQPLRTLRVPDHIWDAAKSTADSRGESLNAATNRFLAGYGGVDAAPQPWILQPDQVLEFGRVLAAAGVLDTADDAFYYIEKPYKWDDLHTEWERLEQPLRPERGEKTDARSWEAFVAYADKQQ